MSSYLGTHTASCATLLGALLLTGLASPLAAQTPLVLTDDRGEYSLGHHLEILEDESKAWTLEDVMSPALSPRFRPSPKNPPNFGFTDSAYWVRFRVTNLSETTAWRLVVHFANMNHVAFYRPAPDGQGYIVQETGNKWPLATREIPHYLVQFKLPSLASHAASTPETQTFYMRFENEATMALPLKLWSQQDLEQRNQLGILGLGVFYGIMLTLIAYNLLLCLSLRDASYFYHVLHVALSALCLLARDGLAQQYLWPREVAWDPRALLVFLFAAIAMALMFTIALLKTRTLAPLAHKVLVGFTVVAVGFTLLSFLLPYSTLVEPAILFQLTSFSLILLISWTIWRRGYRPARFFVASWFLFAITVPILLTLTRVLAILPATWTNVATRCSTVGFFLLFSLALADRIHIVRNEKAQAQADLLREQRNALAIKDEMNAALQSSKTELETRNAELERYAYTVSHDLRSPLVTIKGFLGLHEKELAEGKTENRTGHIHRVYAAADKMSRLLDELLEMSRIGRVMGPPETIDLSELATEAAELVTGPASERDVSIEIDPQMPQVSGDRTRLLEVFQNLIENAVKFSRDQATPRIEISAWHDQSGPDERGPDESRRGEGEVTCCVRDNGIGIKPAYHETVFGLFDQLDPSGGGTGIGLALVKRIVEVHGGKIWVESEGDGHGCAFIFTLPRHTF